MARDEHLDGQRQGRGRGQGGGQDRSRGQGRGRRPGPPVDAHPDEAGWQVPGYTHRKTLGSGASGRVVEARRGRVAGIRVAIKYLRPGVVGFALRREAEVLARVASPHVTRLYEYVECGPDSAIVMELVDGVSLKEMLQARGATTPEAALLVLKGSLLGLAAAHAAGIVHRDYKPGNVLVTVDGLSKLVDFGVAVPFGDDGEVSGTPAYLAPEMWAGEPASPAGDVYAATATFFECVTGVRPFRTASRYELALAHTYAAVPDHLAPEPVRPLLLAGLAKAPGQRPPGAAEFLAMLEAAAAAGYGERWEERGREHLAALAALLLLLRRGAASPVTDATTALAHTTLPSPVDGASAVRGGRARLGRARAVRRRLPRRLSRRAQVVAGTAAGLLAVAALAGVAIAGVGDRADRTVLGDPMPYATTSFGAAGGGSGGTGGSGPAPSGSGTRRPTSAAPSPGPSSPVPPASPSGPSSAPPGGSSAPPPPTPGRTPTVTPTRPGPPSPVRTSPTVPVPPPVTTTAVTPPPVVTSSTRPTAPPEPPPTRVTRLNIDGLSCSGPTGLAARITVETTGRPGAVLNLTWMHHTRTGANEVVGRESVSLGSGTTVRTATHEYGTQQGTYWWWVLSISTTPTAGGAQTTYQEFYGPSCSEPG